MHKTNATPAGQVRLLPEYYEPNPETSLWKTFIVEEHICLNALLCLLILKDLELL